MGRIPLKPTLIVLAAVAIMIGLGIWQISRLHQKEALLARYGAAQTNMAEAPFPQDDNAAAELLYRHSRVDCLAVRSITPRAGHNARGESGLAQTADCQLAGGGSARVVLGWSLDPATRDWRGGVVTGVIAPGPRLVADPPLAGLEANEKPDPKDIPNNHLSYVVQWFLFAATALVIYALALRKRLAGEPPHR